MLYQNVSFDGVELRSLRASTIAFYICLCSWILYNVGFFSFWLLLSAHAKEKKSALRPDTNEIINYTCAWREIDQRKTSDRHLWKSDTPSSARQRKSHTRRIALRASSAPISPPPVLAKQEAKFDVEAVRVSRLQALTD